MFCAPAVCPHRAVPRSSVWLQLHPTAAARQEAPCDCTSSSSSCCVSAGSCFPQHQQLERNFPWSEDLTHSNHLEEFWCFQHLCWDSGALVLVPMRVTNMQYKSSCVRSFQIRLKPNYSWAQKAQKEPRKIAFVSVHSNEFHGKLASESIQSWMHDAGFCAHGAFMLQGMFLGLWNAKRLEEFCDVAANQCVTVTCLITARFGREEQNTTFSILRPLFLFCGKKNTNYTSGRKTPQFSIPHSWSLTLLIQLSNICLPTYFKSKPKSQVGSPHQWSLATGAKWLL